MSIRVVFKGCQLFKFELEQRKKNVVINNTQESLLSQNIDEDVIYKKIEKDDDDVIKEEIITDDKLLTNEEKIIEEKRLKDKNELESIIKYENSTPLLMIFCLVITLVIVIVLALLRGGHGVQSVIGILPCSIWYWIVFLFNFPIVIIIVVMFGIYLLGLQLRKHQLGYHGIKGDVKWNLCNLIFLPFLFFFAGCLSSLLGIGSGMVKAPILNEMGLEPAVSAATSTFMILFTATSTSSQYILLGRMPLDYGLFFGLSGFLAALVGQLVIGYIVKKYKFQSLMVFLLAFVMILSILLMGALGIYKFVISVINNEYLGFKSPC